MPVTIYRNSVLIAYFNSINKSQRRSAIQYTKQYKQQLIATKTL